MARQEPEGDGKGSRAYSLASAPLRLLSHSFHSTANTHSLGNNLPPSPALAQLPSKHTHAPGILPKERSVDATQAHVAPVPRQASKRETRHTNDPLASILHSTMPYSTFHHQQPALHIAQAQQTPKGCRDDPPQPTADPRPSLHPGNEVISRSRPLRKPTKIATRSIRGEVVQSAVEHACPDAEDSRARLERLLSPYDVRYSIFRHLSLQDLYYCQSACRLLYWATSDQSIWKRIALNLIQGEFYFDIPKALPANIPNWKFFCKRHLLRQRNWRQGQVQDVISLDDNYKKLTTLQIMAPFVLTGCDDGRIHLWNISTRTLLHRFQVRGEITWVEHLQEQKIVAGLGYDIEKMKSEIRLFSTESGEEIGYYKEDFWDLAICAINAVFLVASDGEGRYTTWDWRTGAKVSHFQVENETAITEALYLVQNTILELHYDGMIRLFSIHGECYGRLTLDNILPDHQVSFCWLHNDFSMVVWESSNTMAHIRLPLLMQSNNDESKDTLLQSLGRPISQEEWDAQGAEVYWRHQLQHTCNFAAMGGGRFQLLYVEIFENLMDQVPIRVHSLRRGRSASGNGGAGGSDTEKAVEEEGAEDEGGEDAEYVTAHSPNPEMEKIIQGLRPSRIDCDPEYIAVGLVQGGVRLLQFAPIDEELLEQTPPFAG